MSKPTKASTCKFNANRDHTNIALPFCKWAPQEEVMPPHIYLSRRGSELDFTTCKNCMAYQAFVKPVENLC